MALPQRSGSKATKQLGHFSSEVEAAVAYARALKEYEASVPPAPVPQEQATPSQAMEEDCGAVEEQATPETVPMSASPAEAQLLDDTAAVSAMNTARAADEATDEGAVEEQAALNTAGAADEATDEATASGRPAASSPPQQPSRESMLQRASLAQSADTRQLPDGDPPPSCPPSPAASEADDTCGEMMPSLQSSLQISEGSAPAAPPAVAFMPLPHASDEQCVVSAGSTAATGAALEAMDPQAESGHSAEEVQISAQGQLMLPVPLEAKAVEAEGQAAPKLVGEAEGWKLHFNVENVTGYRGVYLVTSRRGPTPFEAEGSGSVHLGYFATAVEAAVCYARHEQQQQQPATRLVKKALKAPLDRTESMRSVEGESRATPALAGMVTRRRDGAVMHCSCGKPLQMLRCDDLTCDVCESQLTHASTAGSSA